MLKDSDYIRLSLELHLFFARIMKEHSFFLEAGFLDKDKEYKKIAEDFQISFGGLLNEVIDLSNGNIGNDILLSKEIVTDSTLRNENKTSQLLGLFIDENLTRMEMNLTSGIPRVSEQFIRTVDQVNQKALMLIENLIHFKSDVLNRVLNCKMFTGNYPLLIEHIINEAKMYHSIIVKLLKREVATNQYIYEQEIFWNNIMKEHAEFIRGLLDPTEKELILKADKFANEYETILQSSQNSNMDLTTISLQETVQFKAFKEAGEAGILDCKIRSIIIPLLTDHVLREANHFIRILKSYNRSTPVNY